LASMMLRATSNEEKALAADLAALLEERDPFRKNHDFQIAPGIEYNFTPAVGLIAGAALTVDGHNTNDFIQPQCAVNIVF